MITQIIMPAQTTAAISTSFSTIESNTSSLVCTGLTGSEVAAVQIYDAVYADFTDYIIDGIIQQFNVNNIVVEIEQSCLTYRINKPITVNSVGVALTQNIAIGV